jgi:tripartite-type tricarboxylate transporter receptor subunit TctC
MDANSWNAIFLPKGTPAPIVAKLNAAAIAAMAAPAVQQRLHELGASLPQAGQLTPQYLQTFVESEIRTWGAVIKAVGIAVE